MTSEHRPRATFGEIPNPIPGVRRFVLDCRHGTTTGDMVGPLAGPTADRGVILEQLVARHVASEGCDCAGDLRPQLAEARA